MPRIRLIRSWDRSSSPVESRIIRRAIYYNDQVVQESDLLFEYVHTRVVLTRVWRVVVRQANSIFDNTRFLLSREFDDIVHFAKNLIQGRLVFRSLNHDTVSPRPSLTVSLACGLVVTRCTMDTTGNVDIVSYEVRNCLE